MNAPAVHVKWVLMPVFCALTGYTKEAVRKKVARGQWIEGRQYRRAPDGHIIMNMEAYYQWVEGTAQAPAA